MSYWNQQKKYNVQNYKYNLQISLRTQIRKKNIPEVVEGAKVVGATVTIGAETQDGNSKLLNILNIIKQYLSLPKFSQH